MKRKKILVIGYTSVNLGDDLFFKILFEKFPDHEFYLLAKKKYYSIFSYENVTIIGNSVVNKILWKYSQSLLFKILARRMDGCVIMGGSIFMQNQNAERQLAYKSLIIRSFYGKNKKVFVLGSNFGPFHSQGFYDAYKKLFSKLEDLCFRDSKSYELFSDLNNVRYAPDVVFSLKSSIPLNEKKRQVGFSLINIKNRQGLGQHHHSYISKMAELVKKFVQDNYEVKLFSFCEGEGDIQSIYEVIDTDPEIKDKVKIINYLGAIDATLDEFQSCEFIIGTRFHSIILGLLFECHIIPIYYSDKTFNYLNDLGIGHFGFWIEDIEKLTFRKIMGSQPLSVHKLHILEADQQFKKLSQFLYK